MIKRVLMGALAASMAACAVHAESGWYISADVGGYFRQSEQIKQTVWTPAPYLYPFFYCVSCNLPNPETAQVTTHYTPGIVGHIAVGRRLFSKLRVEAEIGIAHYSSNKATASGAGAGLNGSGDYVGQGYAGIGKNYLRYTEEGNVFYDLPSLNRHIIPYVGVGFGVAEAKSGGVTYTASDTNYINQQEAQYTQPFVMLEAGISLKLTRRLSLVPSYRYQRAVILDQNEYVRYGGGNPNSDIAHQLKVGLRYAF